MSNPYQPPGSITSRRGGNDGGDGTGTDQVHGGVYPVETGPLLQRGWALISSTPLLIIGNFLLAFIAGLVSLPGSIADIVAEILRPEMSSEEMAALLDLASLSIQIFFQFVSVAIQGWVSLGNANAMLKAIRGETVELTDFFLGPIWIGRGFGSIFLFTIALVLGCLFFIIPYFIIFAGLGLWAVSYTHLTLPTICSV